jgi:hypothetical protein
VDQFLKNHRKKANLETLRDDLGMYLKVLRSAMIELINKDYAEFVNLSSNLIGLDKAISSIQVPLGQLNWYVDPYSVYVQDKRLVTFSFQGHVQGNYNNSGKQCSNNDCGLHCCSAVFRSLLCNNGLRSYCCTTLTLIM